MDRAKTDIVVVGAGVIGLALGRALAQSGREVMVLEARPDIGMETSSRNSEVIHAGLYYEPGSLKARTCLQGRDRLYDYCQRKGVRHQRVGKLIVATAEEEAAGLEAIAANARSCGVAGLEWLKRGEIASLEPAVNAAAGLWSPDTGIIDSHALMLALRADIEAAGGTVACNTRVNGGRAMNDGIELHVGDEEGMRLTATAVFNAAGLHATRLARAIEDVDPGSIPAVHLVRGHYFGFSGRSPLRHLVYPLPERGGLGIHGTLDLAGRLRFGPDAEPIDRIDYAFDESRRGRFARSIRRWLPQMEAGQLQPGYTGIRPRLAAPGDGFRDFMLSEPEDHGVPGLLNLYGIESPGLTACLALADEAIGRLLD